MAAPTTPRPTPGPSRAASIRGSGSEDESDHATATEEIERYVVKSLEMVVAEGGKNFSAGELAGFFVCWHIVELETDSCGGLCA
jgi:hypothetical protein